MGLFKLFKNRSFKMLSESFSNSAENKDLFDDWLVLKDEHKGFFNALTMAKNFSGGGMVYRCRTKDQQETFTISIPTKNNVTVFQKDLLYKVRLKFSNSVVLYAKLHAYKERHAVILGMTDDILENMADSNKLRLEFVAENDKKYILKFSLRGAPGAIKSTSSRCLSNLKDYPQYLYG